MLAYSEGMDGDTAAVVADLSYSWGGAYTFRWSDARQEFSARRADNDEVLHSATAGGLRAMVRADYAESPVVKPSATVDAMLRGEPRAR